MDADEIKGERGGELKAGDRGVEGLATDNFKG